MVKICHKQNLFHVYFMTKQHCFLTRGVDPILSSGVTKKATGYMRIEKQMEQLDSLSKPFLLPSPHCNITHSRCLFAIGVGISVLILMWGQGRVFTRVVTSHSELWSLSRSPRVSSCWYVYVMPVELTIVLSDLNTNCKLVFSLALAMTFTSLLPWRLAGISYLYYLASLVCECLCVCMRTSDLNSSEYVSEKMYLCCDLKSL